MNEIHKNKTQDKKTGQTPDFRNLKDYEKNNAITELECLAIIDALNKFYHYVYHQKFIIHTNHGT